MCITQRYFGVVIFLFLTLASHHQVAAQFVRDPEAVAAYEKGEGFLQQEQWEDAVTAFSQAVQIDPTFPEAFAGLGDALRELEDYDSSIMNYRQAIDINPKLARAYNGRGVCYREQNDINSAAIDFEEASRLDRKNPEIAANWGDILVNNVQDPIRAMRYLDIAIELNPQHAEAYRNRGWAHLIQRQFDEAVEDMKKSIEIDPNDYETHSRLASVYIFEEKYSPAIDSLSRAIETYKPEEIGEPDKYIEGFMQRANISIKLANEEETPEAKKALFEAAIADADTVLEEFPDRFPESGQALYKRGVAQRMLGQLGQAIKSLTDAIQLTPAGSDSSYLAEAYLKRGICWHYQEQSSLARGDFEQSATLNYEDPLPHLWIGYTYAQEEDYRRAIESYGDAISKNSKFPMAYVNRGLAYMQLEEYKKAADNFNEAIRHESEDLPRAKHFYLRGISYMKVEDYQKAYDSFNLATLNDESYAAAFRKAAEALRKLGRPIIADQYDKRADKLETP